MDTEGSCGFWLNTIHAGLLLYDKCKAMLRVVLGKRESTDSDERSQGQSLTICLKHFRGRSVKIEIDN